MKNIALLFILLAMIYAEFSLGNNGSFKTDSCLNYANHVLGKYRSGSIQNKSSIINLPKPGSPDFNSTLDYEQRKSDRKSSINIFHVVANTKEDHRYKIGDVRQELAINSNFNEEKNYDYDYSILVNNKLRKFPETGPAAGDVINKHYQFAINSSGKCELKRIVVESTLLDVKTVKLDFKLCASLLKGLSKDKNKVKALEKIFNEDFREECEKLVDPSSTNSNPPKNPTSGVGHR